MRNAFQTGAKIYLSEKNILGIWALEVQNLGKDDEGKYSETFTTIQVKAVFFLTEKTKNFSSAQKVAQNEKKLLEIQNVAIELPKSRGKRNLRKTS